LAKEALNVQKATVALAMEETVQTNVTGGRNDAQVIMKESSNTSSAVRQQQILQEILDLRHHLLYWSQLIIQTNTHGKGTFDDAMSSDDDDDDDDDVETIINL
jgi:hypothetical protein